MMQFKSWLSKIADKYFPEHAIVKIAVPEDMSLSQLQDLYNKGYRYVRWITSQNPCDKCKRLNNREWYLKDFIANLQHAAPIYEHSHPGCGCVIEIIHEDEYYYDPVLIEANTEIWR